MKKPLFFFIFLISFSVFCQDIDRDKEAKDTIDWLNQKLIQYQYESNEVKQIFIVKKIEKVEDEFFLFCLQEQWLNNSVLTREIIKIPISKINSISFNEKTHNYWLEIKINSNEAVIINIPSSGHDYTSNHVSILLSKSIDEESLRPRIQKAFTYLFELFGNKKTEKF